ncbi:MAG: hypothetical protein Q8O30_08480 [Candidatus Omnitrophota bacterium]|nr:hypothetical protein [Candidatus Omnitrophota bacterium]
MLQVEIKDKVDKILWNDLVRSLPEGTIFQTTYWADYLEKSGYSKPYYFIVRENQNIKGILLLWVEILSARTRKYYNTLWVLDYFAKKANLAVGNWLHGPLIFDKSNQYKILEKFILEIDKFAISRNLVAIRNLASPILYDAKFFNKDITEDIYILHEFTPMPKATVFLDLSKDLDSIWKGLRQKTKDDLRKGLKNNIAIEFMQQEELAEYERLMLESTKRRKIELPPHYPNDIMWTALRKDEKCLEVITVKKEGKILGAKGILEFNGIIFQICSFQSNLSYNNKMNVNDIMTWEVVKWGVINKKRIYDLTGVPAYPRNKKEEGLRHFKIKWGNKLIMYNAYEKVYRKYVKAGKELLKRFI